MPSPSIGDNRVPSKSQVPGIEWVSGSTVRPDLLLRPVRVISFWAAIALPFLHLPLLLHGLNTTAELYAFLGLLALNLVALVVGHGYKTE